MARKPKRFRLDALDPLDRQTLSTYLQGLVPSRYTTADGPPIEGLYDQIEAGSYQVPDQEISYIQPKRIKDILAKLPKTKKEAIKKYIEKTKNEAVLTDDELQDRLQGFQDLKNLPDLVTKPTLGRKEYGSWLKAVILGNLKDWGLESSHHALKDGGIGDDVAGYILGGGSDPQWIADRIKDLTLAGGGDTGTNKIGNFKEFKNDDATFNAIKSVAGNVMGLAQGNKAAYTMGDTVTKQSEDTTADIDRVTGLLGTRQVSHDKDTAVSDYISALPDELSASREDFLKGARSRAISEYQGAAPRILGGLNAAGLLFSGDVEDELSSRALGLASGIEGIRAKMESDDSEFYYDAAYRNTLRKSLEDAEKYQDIITADRNKVISKRDDRFREYQSDLDRVLDEQLSRDDAERRLRLRKSELDANKETSRNQREANLYGDLISAGGSIGGAYLGSKMGGSGGSGGSGGGGGGSPAPAFNPPGSIG